MQLLIHWLKALFRWISLMVMIPLLILALLLTPLGLKIGLALLREFAPGELHYQQVTGTLIGPLAIKQLRYRYQDRQLAISNLSLQWHPSELLAGKISIDTLNMDSLVISSPTAPTPAPAPQFSVAAIKQGLQTIRPQLTALHLPVKLAINHTNIHSIIWQQQPSAPSLQATNVQIADTLIQPNAIKINIRGQIIKPYPIQTQLRIEGAPQQYRFTLQASNPQTQWVVNGQVHPDEFELDTQKALILGGELSLHLLWKWQTRMSWDLALTGRHLDLSQLQSTWPHPLDITLHTTGYLGEDRPHFSWNTQIKSAQNQIITQGKYDKQWDVTWNLKIHQLAEFLPFSNGAITSTGELHGSLTRPQTKGNLNGSLLRWQNNHIDTLKANWDVDISEAHSSFVQVSAQSLFTEWAALQTLQLAAQGKWKQHQINATIQGYHANLELALEGGMQADHWQGSVRTLSILAPHVGAWRLSQPTAVSVSSQSVNIPALCLQSNAASKLCLGGQWSGLDEAWKIGLNGQLNLQQFAALTPEPLHVNLPIDLHLNATGMGKTIHSVQLNGSTPTGHIRYSGANLLNLHIQAIKISAQWVKDAITLHLEVGLADNNSISAELELPKVSVATLFSKEQVLQGKVSIDLNNLAPIQALLPDVVNPHGQFHARFAVSGTLATPLVSGQGHLEGGEVKIPGLNIQLNQINLSLTAQGSELHYTLNANSAGQPLQLVGQTHLNEADFPTELTLTGDNLLLADTSVYKIYVTPRIKVLLKGGTIDVSGTVDIPKAVLNKLALQSETTLPQGEVVFIGEHPMVTTTPWNMNMNLQLTISLGKDVIVADPGLKGKLSGSLTLVSQPGQVILATGNIDITDGVYSVYGRQLTVTSGSGLIYQRNPISNPILNVQAITRIVVTDPVSQQQLGANEVTVGMTIAGTSSSPQVTLFSSAGNLSQADILSFLLLGTSSSGISPTNINLMLQALNTLPLTKKGAGSVEGLTNQVKQGLGLSELGVESEPTFGAMGETIPSSTPASYFVVGKRLTSRIYLRYKYDPFNSVNLFQLNYLFSQNWSLQLETDGGNQNGADLLYTIQTGTSRAADKTQGAH